MNIIYIIAEKNHLNLEWDYLELESWLWPQPAQTQADRICCSWSLSRLQTWETYQGNLKLRIKHY